MKLRLNISPCPNDTFMFDALVNGRIDTTGGIGFETSFADIEQLNARAIAGEVDVCKVSYAVLPLIAERYRILGSGSALGRGNGPLLVSSGDFYMSAKTKIAIPGEHTTANLLLWRLFPELADRTPVLFSEIADRVMAGEFDAGVLIHEGRFTYAEKGLRLVADLGQEWERRTGLPLPLGAIVVSRTMPEGIQQQVDTLVRQSVEFAFANPALSRDFVRSHAQELDDAVIDSHIELFVNDHSVELGAEGRRAVRELTGLMDNDIFVNNG